MNRLAVFVEGETEQLFVERLVREFAGLRGLHVERTAARGGTSNKRRTRFVRAAEEQEGIEFFVLIVDCGGDGGVKSRIIEEYHNLVEFGYQALVALRDSPASRDDIPRFRETWPVGVPDTPVSVILVLAIMEIEAWFLAEYTHFQHLNAELTPDRIQQELGFDPRAPNLRERNHPARDIDNAYQLVGERYQKGRAAQRTIYWLDIERLSIEMTTHEEEIQRLVSALDDFFSLPV